MQVASTGESGLFPLTTKKGAPLIIWMRFLSWQYFGPVGAFHICHGTTRSHLGVQQSCQNEIGLFRLQSNLYHH